MESISGDAKEQVVPVNLIREVKKVMMSIGSVTFGFFDAINGFIYFQDNIFSCTEFILYIVEKDVSSGKKKGILALETETGLKTLKINTSDNNTVSAFHLENGLAFNDHTWIFLNENQNFSYYAAGTVLTPGQFSITDYLKLSKAQQLDKPKEVFSIGKQNSGSDNPFLFPSTKCKITLFPQSSIKYDEGVVTESLKSTISNNSSSVCNYNYSVSLRNQEEINIHAEASITAGYSIEASILFIKATETLSITLSFGSSFTSQHETTIQMGGNIEVKSNQAIDVLQYTESLNSSDQDIDMIVRYFYSKESDTLMLEKFFQRNNIKVTKKGQYYETIIKTTLRGGRKIIDHLYINDSNVKKLNNNDMI